MVTADSWLIAARRSDRVGVGKGWWNCSVNEGLQRRLDSVDGGAPNLFQAARRGVREELAIDADDYDLRLLAFAVVTSSVQWCALFVARLTDITRHEFEHHVTRGIPDGWEHRTLDYVRFDPDQVIGYLLRDDRRDSWAPAAPPSFYLSLVNTFGRAAVERAVRTATRGQG